MADPPTADQGARTPPPAGIGAVLQEIEQLQEAGESEDFRDGVRASWEATRRLLRWFWVEYCGQLGPDAAAAPSVPADTTDARRVSRVVGGRLRDHADTLDRCAERRSEVSDNGVTRALANTAEHLRVTAEALEHLVEHHGRVNLTEPPTLTLLEEEPAGPELTAAGWLAAFSVTSVLMEEEAEQSAADIQAMAGGDAVLIDLAAAELDTLREADPATRERARARLRAAARSSR